MSTIWELFNVEVVVFYCGKCPSYVCLRRVQITVFWVRQNRSHVCWGSSMPILWLLGLVSVEDMVVGVVSGEVMVFWACHCREYGFDIHASTCEYMI